VDIDYSYYLGKNYDAKEIEKKQRVPTIVSNHISFLDILVFLVSRYMPGFASKAEVKTTPLIGYIA
jgi:1-acyl-sn-glycerol-3-phosphate acyltransferase